MGKKNYYKKNLLKLNFFLINILVLFLVYNPLKSEIVNNLEITGNKRVSSETIKIYGDIDLTKDLDEKSLNNILKNLFETNFFEDVSVKIENKTLKVKVKEYPVINQLIFVGEPSNRIKDQIKDLISTKQNKSFISSNLSNDIEIIKKLYSSAGFNFVEIETKIKKIDDFNLDLIVEIDKGIETKISSISFIGNKKIRENKLRDIIASEEDKFWKFISRNTKFSQNLIQLDLRLLNNFYKSLGYYDIKINSNTAQINKEGNIDLVYSIDAGERYKINKILTDVDPTFDKKLFLSMNKEYKKYIGQYYSPFKITKLLNELDSIISKNNLQFVEHNVEEIIEDNFITIKFNVFEGEKVLVERINIKGNSVTDEAVIRGELLLDEGDPFSNTTLEKSVSEIKSRNLFSSVETTVVDGSDTNLKIIELQVEERPTGEISAGAGIGTSGGSFAIAVTENNWLGQGKELDFELEVDQESLGGTLSYTDPNVNFLGNETNYTLSSISNDKPDQGYENAVYSIGTSTSFEQFKDIYTSLGISATYDDLRTNSSASSSLKKQSGKFSEISGRYGFSYDTRDRSFMPRSGGVTKFSQSLPVIADSQYVSNILSMSKYKMINENFLGASKFYLAAVNGLGDDNVRLSKRNFLSTSRIRGFEKGKIGPVDGTDHIGGNYAASANFELNLPNFLPENTKTDFGFFVDFANVWGVDYDDSIDESNKLRSSLGAAANWSSPLGPLSFVLSTNLSKASTDKTESFNFNLGTTF